MNILIIIAGVLALISTLFLFINVEKGSYHWMNSCDCFAKDTVNWMMVQSTTGILMTVFFIPLEAFTPLTCVFRKKKIFEILLSISLFAFGGCGIGTGVIGIVEGYSEKEAFPIIVLVFSSIDIAIGLANLAYSLFCKHQNNLNVRPQMINKEPQNETRKTESNDYKESIEKIKALKELFDSGIISKEDFEEKKKKYLDKI